MVGYKEADEALSSHFSKRAVKDRLENILETAVHYRGSDYEINGERYFLIQEIQSDFFQEMRKAYESNLGSKAYKEFLDKTPYAGTNHWVALAFRHVLDGIVKGGNSYKGIAWLDGRMQTALEWNYDPYLKIPLGSMDISTASDSKKVLQNFWAIRPSFIYDGPTTAKQMKDIQDILDDKGRIWSIENPDLFNITKKDTIASYSGWAKSTHIELKVKGGETIILKRTKDYESMEFLNNKQSVIVRNSPELLERLKGKDVEIVVHTKSLNYFQDTIVTKAIARQMKLNGIDVDIKHDKNLHMHVMPLSELDINTVRVQGQPIYAKALPDPDFKPIAPSEAPIPPPKEWDKNNPQNDPRFKNSVAVHKNGKPRLLYHGSSDIRDIRTTGEFRSSLERFGGKLSRLNVDDIQSSKTFFFVDSLRVARTYADNMRAFDSANAVPGTVKSHLILKNPLVVDAKGGRWRKFQVDINGETFTGTTNIVAAARRLGYDGLIVKDVKDTYTAKGKGSKLPAANVYVAFSPNQIVNAQTGELMSSFAKGGLSPRAQQLVDMKDNIARTQELLEENIKLKAAKDAVKDSLKAMPEVAAVPKVLKRETFTDKFKITRFDDYKKTDPVVVFSKENDLREFAKRVVGIEDDYRTVTVDAVGKNKFTVRAFEGDYIEYISREVTVNKKGHVTSIYHNSLSIRDSYQGEGIAGNLLSDSFDEYNKLGVKKIGLEAVGKGSYAWARYGFIPTKRNLFNLDVTDAIDGLDLRKVTTSKAVDAKIRKELKILLDKTGTDQVAQVIASYKYGRYKIGKSVLEGVSSWTAEFRLGNPNQVRYFNLYANKERIKRELELSGKKAVFDGRRLTAEERKSIHSWTKSDSRPWRNIYKQAETSPGILLKANDAFKRFDSLFAQYAPDYSGSVYRLLQREKNFKVGDIISDVSPTSVSRSMRGIKAFSKSLDDPARTLLTVRKPKKAIGYQIDTISFYKEEEILLPPRTILKVVEIKKGRDFKSKNLNNVTEYVLEYVDEPQVDPISLKIARLSSARIDLAKEQKLLAVDSVRKSISVEAELAAIAKAERAAIAATAKEAAQKSELENRIANLKDYVRKFKPIPPSESPTGLVPVQYSSLERLIENQRPLDKRNGKQWSKYFVTQGMNPAEIKHTGVWEILESNKTKEVTKEDLLAAINKNRLAVIPHEVQVDDFLLKKLAWNNEMNKELDNIGDPVYEEVTDGLKNRHQIFRVQESNDSEFTIYKTIPERAGARPVYRVYWEERALLSNEHHRTLSDAQHGAQRIADEDLNQRDVDWRSMTIEADGTQGRSPKNYREVVIEIPGAAGKNPEKIDDYIREKLNQKLSSHFGKQIANIPLSTITDVEDIVVHYRASDYEINGGKYLLVQEIQSDFFQELRKLLGDNRAQTLLDDIPYAGTNNWVALAIRDAISKVAEDGDYKGIAWLDGRRQTRLEKGFDPEIPRTVSPNGIFDEGSVTPHFKVTKDKFNFNILGVSKNYKGHTISKKEYPEFSKLVEEGGSILKIKHAHYGKEEFYIAFDRIDDKLKPLVPGVDFKVLYKPPGRMFNNFVVFRKGLFKESDFYGDVSLLGAGETKVTLHMKRANPFTVYQDNIIPTAVKKQMTRNGLKANIKHDEKLGFYVMDIDEKSQLLIKEKGQPTYAKAIPLFKPLDPSSSPIIKEGVFADDVKIKMKGFNSKLVKLEEKEGLLLFMKNNDLKEEVKKLLQAGSFYKDVTIEATWWHRFKLTASGGTGPIKGIELDVKVHPYGHAFEDINIANVYFNKNYDFPENIVTQFIVDKLDDYREMGIASISTTSKILSYEKLQDIGFHVNHLSGQIAKLGKKALRKLDISDFTSNASGVKKIKRDLKGILDDGSNSSILRKLHAYRHGNQEPGKKLMELIDFRTTIELVKAESRKTDLYVNRAMFDQHLKDSKKSAVFNALELDSEHRKALVNWSDANSSEWRSIYHKAYTDPLLFANASAEFKRFDSIFQEYSDDYYGPFYRVIQGNIKVNIGDVIGDTAPIGVSIDRFGIQKFGSSLKKDAKTLLTFKSSGKPLGYRINHIAKFGESEVIIPPRTSFKVVEINKNVSFKNEHIENLTEYVLELSETDFKPHPSFLADAVKSTTKKIQKKIDKLAKAIKKSKKTEAAAVKKLETKELGVPVYSTKKDFSSIEWEADENDDLYKWIYNYTLGDGSPFPANVSEDYFPNSANASYRLLNNEKLSLEVGDVYKDAYFNAYANSKESLSYFYKNDEGELGTRLAVIKVNNKNNIKFGYDISDLSHFPEEGEVIIPAGVRFKVSKINKNVKYKGIGKVTEYVVDLEEESVSSYIKKFKPIDPSKAPSSMAPVQYSSLERLIENQRPLDKRNGKQWLKYLTTQDMSLAEMKHMGVWEILENNKTKEIPKETLLATMSKNKAAVNSYEAQDVGHFSEQPGAVLEWDEPINKKVTSKTAEIYKQINSMKLFDSEVFEFQHSKNGEFSVIKVVPPPSQRAKHSIVYYLYETKYQVVSTHTAMEDVSDIRHYAQDTWSNWLSEDAGSAKDWRSLTIESQKLVKKDFPENYREVLIQLPGASSKIKQLPSGDDLVTAVDQTLLFHFRDQFERVSAMVGEISIGDTIVHYRMSDYTIDGKKYLLIQEIQSDYFQKIKRLRGDATPHAYKKFLEKTPYSGTNNWVALAIRDALSKVAEEGDYKGIAWLDGRTQTRLEKSYDPFEPTEVTPAFLGDGYYKPVSKVVGDNLIFSHRQWNDRSITINKKNNPIFSKLLEKGGTVIELSGDHYVSGSSLVHFTRKGVAEKIASGIDYSLLKSSDVLETTLPRKGLSLLVFRKGLFKSSDFHESNGAVRWDETSPIIGMLRENKFAVYQDNIIPTAVRKQMTRNGLDPKIIHDKKLGFHIMDIDEKSQLLIKERGQPTYAKAVPPKGFDFKPLDPSEAPKKDLIETTKAPFYSGLQRLIGVQRDTDVRNGKQWRKYLESQGMSEAEIKVRGVWDELENNLNKKVTKERLLEILQDNKIDSYPLPISRESKDVDALVWKTPGRITKKQNAVMLSLINNSFEATDVQVLSKVTTPRILAAKFEVFIVEAFNLDKSIGKAILYRNLVTEDFETRLNVPPWHSMRTTQLPPSTVFNREGADVSEYQHFVQGAMSAYFNDDHIVDWRSLTIEKKGIIGQRRRPVNYKEVTIQVPELRRAVSNKEGTVIRVSTRYSDNDLSSHFGSRIRELKGDIKETAAHYRTTDYEINGEKYLLIQEIQSDFFQKVQTKQFWNQPLDQKDSDPYKEFLDKTPYAGTNHWVALAFRHALDDAVKKGDYKGIAWLDGRRQTHLEKDYDPKNKAFRGYDVTGGGMSNFETARYSKVDWFDFRDKGIGDWYRVDSKKTGNFSKLVEEGGTVFRLSTRNSPTVEGFNYIQKPGSKKKYLVRDVDYSMAPKFARDDTTTTKAFGKWVVFKKGIISKKDWDYSEPTTVRGLNRDIMLGVVGPNPFSVFQDKIVTSAISKQMKRNGVKVDITHNKDLGFHIMPLPDKTQRLILENSQPVYAPVKTISEPEFKPLDPSDAPIAAEIKAPIIKEDMLTPAARKKVKATQAKHPSLKKNDILSMLFIEQGKYDTKKFKYTHGGNNRVLLNLPEPVVLGSTQEVIDDVDYVVGYLLDNIKKVLSSKKPFSLFNMSNIKFVALDPLNPNITGSYFIQIYSGGARLLSFDELVNDIIPELHFFKRIDFLEVFTKQQLRYHALKEAITGVKVDEKVARLERVLGASEKAKKAIQDKAKADKDLIATLLANPNMKKRSWSDIDFDDTINKKILSTLESWIEDTGSTITNEMFILYEPNHKSSAYRVLRSKLDLKVGDNFIDKNHSSFAASKTGLENFAEEDSGWKTVLRVRPNKTNYAYDVSTIGPSFSRTRRGHCNPRS